MRNLRKSIGLTLTGVLVALLCTVSPNTKVDDTLQNTAKAAKKNSYVNFALRAEQNYITTVDISGITVPEAGKVLSTTYDILPPGTPYTVENIYWYDNTLGAKMFEGDNVVDGHFYKLYIRVAPNDGYLFSVDENGNSLVNATINGNKARVSKNDGYDNLSEKIHLVYDFDLSVKESAAPDTSASPNASAAPDTSAAPVASASPEVRTSPETSASPNASAAPEVSASPDASATPDDTITDKKDNTLKVSKKTITIKVKDLKKKKKTVKPLTVKDAKGSVSYSLIKKGTDSKIYKKLKITSKGAVTLKKGKYKKGKYKVKLSITAKGNDNYKKLTKKVTVTFKLK